ncbi:Fanconi anemia group I protein homolog [Ostrinia nubilalis]|uniref:Fanconi anemia group I protein homolog n=1 Tax=Ostrinia nubilalis TaxID=29057 RepID=UPI00308263AB
MDTIYLKIKELGHVNSKRDELEEHCKANIDQILKFLPRRILNSDGADILDCLLNGLTNNPSSSSRYSAKIIDIVLQSMRKESTSLTHCSDVISRLCLELSRQAADELVRWSNDSIQSIIGDSDVNMIWRDILPECMNALSSCSEIKHCGTVLTFDEYKQQCIHTLCQCNWTEKQLVQLVAMFKDLQLPRNEHKQVVNKVCSYIINISPDEMPPLIHQLLKLCKLYNVDIVLAHLSHYFSVRLYSKLEPPPNDSESTTMDIDDIVTHSAAELSRCLSTCIYHITDGATEPEVIRRHLKTWPKTQLLRAPFIMDLALAMSEKGPDFRSVCLDAIKSAIERRVLDELKGKESAWVRSVLPPDVDIASVLKVLTTESANHRQLTVVGLINLAFSLLSINKTKPVAQACWSHGKLILVRLCKSQPETAGHILNQLACKLATESAQRQYADCLHVLCKLTPVSIERCPELTTILENCQPSPHDYRAAAAVLAAVHPLVNFSTRSRDALVMVCRKRLYSRDSPHRCLALSGFLTVLRYMKLSRGTFSHSQSVCSQYSGHSYLTQIAVDLHATQQHVVTSRVRNEAMCMEVVSILRRCLVQDAAVKQLLYSNLYECAAEKTALHESILELLYEHLSKYLPEPDAASPPIMLDKCVQLSGVSAVLTEPISHLLFAVAQFLQATEEEDLEDILSSQAADTAAAYLKSKLASVLETVCGNEHLGQIDLEDPSLTDLLPESRAKCLKVQQILQIYEALIAHRIMQWGPSSTNAAAKVYSLYKACNQLLEQTKAPPKSKKGNKTLNETKETVKTQKSQKSQKDKGKGPVKISALTKDRAGPFKPLPCVWDLRFCYRIVELLYSEEVPWSSLEQRNQLRGRRDFHHWALRCVTSVVTDDHLDKGQLAKYAPKVARVMYTRCLCRFQDMCDFDDQTTLGCIEVFKACLTLLLSPNQSLKIESVLPLITGIPDCTASVGLAAILEQLLAAFELVEEEAVAEERDLSVKKHLAALVQTTALLLDVPVVPCQKLSGVIIKLEDYLRTSKQDFLALLPGILSAGCRAQMEAQFVDQLLVKLAAALGRVDEEDTSAGEESTDFPTIDSRSGHTVLTYLCAHVNNRLKRAEHLLARARDLNAALVTAPHQHQQRIRRELTELYKSLVLQLCQLTGCVSRVGKLRCCVGVGSDRVLAAGVRLYALLAQLMKQLPADIAPSLRLERLLKLSGKKLSGVTDNLISYIELSQQQQRASRVLQDTKLIPRLVAEAEQFSNHVILLANRAKLNLQHYLSPGTARDFRIRQPLLQEALNARPPTADDQDETRDNEEINDAATVMISPVASDQDDENASDEETSRKKRRRVS